MPLFFLIKLLNIYGGALFPALILFLDSRKACSENWIDRWVSCILNPMIGFVSVSIQVLNDSRDKNSDVFQCIPWGSYLFVCYPDLLRYTGLLKLPFQLQESNNDLYFCPVSKSEQESVLSLKIYLCVGVEKSKFRLQNIIGKKPFNHSFYCAYEHSLPLSFLLILIYLWFILN